MDPKDRVDTVLKTKADARQEKASDGNRSAPGARHTVPRQEVDAVIDAWPAAPKKVAQDMCAKYGPPNECTPTLLIWHDNGEWKRTIVTSDETAHDFPTPHTDYITQTINYDVPVEKLAELAEFDGSLIVYRTAGQVSATCDNEEANRIAINLMHEIVSDRMTVEAARKEYAEQTAAWVMDRPAPLTDGIKFGLPLESQTGYRDESNLKMPAMHQTVEKVKDVLGVGRD